MIQPTIKRVLLSRISLLVILGLGIIAQNAWSQTFRRSLDWQTPQQWSGSEEINEFFLYFSGAVFSEATRLPVYQEVLPVKGDGIAEIKLTNEEYVPLSAEEIKLLPKDGQLPETPTPVTQMARSRKEQVAILTINPFRIDKETGKWTKLVRFEFNMNMLPASQRKSTAKKNYASQSVLASGQWYKVGVKASGVCKLSYNDLVTLGLSPDNIDPRNLRVYGNGGRMLPHANAAFRYDDLVENAIEVVGESDGKFDTGDYILFYALAPDGWNFDDAKQTFTHEVHGFDYSAYYYITASNGPGKRVQNMLPPVSAPTHVVTSFDDHQFHELDEVNLIKSGREWYGEVFDIITSWSFGFNFPNIDNSSDVEVIANVAARSINVNSTYDMNVSGQSTSIVVPSVSGVYYNEYVGLATRSFSMTPNSDQISVDLTYNKPGASASGWLNFIEVHARRYLQMVGNQMHFQDVASIGTGNVATYQVTNATPALKVWKVTDPLQPEEVGGILNGSTWTADCNADSLERFVAFNGGSFVQPTLVGAVLNQDLHGLAATGTYDMLIVSAPQFLGEAQRLADYHQSFDNISSLIVTPQQIYNEFSSGTRDITAIRDYVKMFYDLAPTPDDIPKYLLLFGDGSYDNKDRLPDNTNFIPTYQSANSHTPTASYVSDDYYGLLDDSEGKWQSGDPDLVDIGVGRLPVKNQAEAKAAVDKIIHYQHPTSTLGDWRNTVCFVADDEDSNLHMSQSDQLAVYVDTNYRDYNVNKIFFDSFQQLSTSGGQRYPDVTDAINRQVEQGALLVNYTGHGGELGWAHERVLDVPDIQGYKNLDNMPVFMTATCEFSRYDDPGRTSAGEYLFLNPSGGGIALFSTVRLVFAVPNFQLNQKFLQRLFVEINGELPRMGDLYRLTKVASGSSVNNRNFALLGDPALRMAYPQEVVKTTGINSKPLAGLNDTLKAMDKVTISGEVTDRNGAKLTSFNGVVFPTIYDKPVSVNTLSNDGGNPFKFQLQKNIIYKGKAQVTNGDFSFTFVVPRDIAYQFGRGKISYYAHDGNSDAHGSYIDFLIGGTSDSTIADNEGPEIDLYMNDKQFVFGGITDENPTLLAYVRDSSGINTVGNGIGHDITAILDGNTEKTIVLNDYYEADLNQYQSGMVEYPLSELEEGRHSLKFKVWDVLNTSSEAYTEFVVAKSADIALEHVLNYPNPFTTKTQFFFDHNQPGQTLQVQVQIFTVSGKLIKTLNTVVQTEGFRSDPIQWDGKDDFGDAIGKGVYVYQLTVQNETGKVAEKTEKLVILK
ncbi:MAG: type IX secretion system sortase PorU [Flavobacteriales bacterium]|nr:type IX secretion system sortase PorU [Flavobacteriales bacterium]